MLRFRRGPGTMTSTTFCGGCCGSGAAALLLAVGDFSVAADVLVRVFFVVLFDVVVLFAVAVVVGGDGPWRQRRRPRSWWNGSVSIFVSNPNRRGGVLLLFSAPAGC